MVNSFLGLRRKSGRTSENAITYVSAKKYFKSAVHILLLAAIVCQLAANDL
jgi:hypothetical protein